MTDDQKKAIDELTDIFWDHHIGVENMDDSEKARSIVLAIANNEINIHALIERVTGKKLVDEQIVKDVISLLICSASSEGLACDDCQHYIEDTTAGEEVSKVCGPRSLDSSEERLVAFVREQIKAADNG